MIDPSATTLAFWIDAAAAFAISFIAMLIATDTATPAVAPIPTDRAAAPANALIIDASVASTLMSVAMIVFCTPSPLIVASGFDAIRLRANTPPAATPTPLLPPATAAVAAITNALMDCSASAVTSIVPRL